MDDVFEELWTSLSDGGVLLCANQRQTRFFRARFDLFMRQTGRTTWPTASIFELRHWCENFLTTHVPETYMLSPIQSHHLWERCIRQSPSTDAESLLQVRATAKAAREAMTLLCDYQQSLSGQILSPDQQAFSTWQSTYLHRLEAHRWLDPAMVPARAAALIEEGAAVPKAVWVTGFEDIPPVFDRLFEAMKRRGGRVRLWESPTAFGQVETLHFLDKESEARAAAQWAFDRVTDAHKSVAVVVPDPQDLPVVERAFLETFAPEQLVQPTENEGTITFSLGRPLADEGLVHAALEALDCAGTVELDRWSFILRSPYLLSGVDAAFRVKLEPELRRFAPKRLHLKQLISLIGERSSAVALQERLDQVNPVQDKGTAQEWALRFDEELKRWGWPGSRSLSSREYQSLTFWREKVLPALASLHLVGSTLSRHEAVAALRTLAAETPFQVEAPSTPVQILGILEAGGLRFDAIRVLGVSEQRFPERARPNPFLPSSLQQAQRMPHSTAQREKDYALHQLRGLLSAAPEVVLSWANGEEVISRPSPLMASLLPQQPLQEIDSPPCGLDTFFEAQLAQTLVLNEAAAYVPPGQETKGGTQVLKEQSLCPFRAFAHFRLGLRGVEAKAVGIDPPLRGKLLHRLLEKFWHQTKTHATLVGYTADRLAQHLSTLIDEVFVEYKGELHWQAGTQIEVEKQRIKTVVLHWLALEKDRSPFTVIATEAKQTVTVGPLSLRVTLDRCDLLPTGERLILDYKTGEAKAKNLIPGKLKEPQLPLYCHVVESPPAGVAFAQLTHENPRFVGVTERSGLLPQVQGCDSAKTLKSFDAKDWSHLLSRWTDDLNRLAVDFCHGVNVVNPLDEDTCTYCDLKPLCRINERRDLEDLYDC